MQRLIYRHVYVLSHSFTIYPGISSSSQHTGAEKQMSMRTELRQRRTMHVANETIFTVAGFVDPVQSVSCAATYPPAPMLNGRKCRVQPQRSMSIF